MVRMSRREDYLRAMETCHDTRAWVARLASRGGFSVGEACPIGQQDRLRVRRAFCIEKRAYGDSLRPPCTSNGDDGTRRVDSLLRDSTSVVGVSERRTR